MLGSLKKLFSSLEDSRPVQEEIRVFNEGEFSFQYEQTDIDFLLGYFSDSFDSSLLSGSVRRLFELSPKAFDVFLHGWMSELPVAKELAAFGRKVLSSAEGAAVCDRKSLAEDAASDMGDSDTLAVHSAVFKVQREIDRMRGLLRFSPQDGLYTARCAPDHFILPALARHFTARFGETSWLIIDEKRRMGLSRLPPERAKLAPNTDDAQNAEGGEWEELWQHYHKTINNEQRENKDLQRQFMPKRYWKYLPEM